jgi:hypothetical protein
VAISGVSNPDADQVTLTVTGVTEDEPVNDGGDGNTSPDAVLQPGGQVLLRAERAGGGNGRVYHVVFMADDGFGVAYEGFVTVCVSHDQGKKGGCIDDGQHYDTTQPYPFELSGNPLRAHG